MRVELLQLLSVLARTAIAMDHMAEALADAAYLSDDPFYADALRRLARQHRIEALKLRSEMAAASQAFGGWPDAQPAKTLNGK